MNKILSIIAIAAVCLSSVALAADKDKKPKMMGKMTGHHMKSHKKMGGKKMMMKKAKPMKMKKS